VISSVSWLKSARAFLFLGKINGTFLVNRASAMTKLKIRVFAVEITRILNLDDALEIIFSSL